MFIRSEDELMFSGSDAKPAAKWALPVLKVKWDKPLCGIICAPDITAHYNHFWGGQTVICLPDNCAACNAGNPQKQMGFFPILLEKNGGRGFVEIPYSAVQFFDRALEQFGTLERRVVKVFREKPNNYSRVRATFHQLCEDSLVLPGFPPTRKWLLNMWGVEVLGVGSEGETGSNNHLSEKTHPLIFRENTG